MCTWGEEIICITRNIFLAWLISDVHLRRRNGRQSSWRRVSNCCGRLIDCYKRISNTNTKYLQKKYQTRKMLLDLKKNSHFQTLAHSAKCGVAYVSVQSETEIINICMIFIRGQRCQLIREREPVPDHVDIALLFTSQYYLPGTLLLTSSFWGASLKTCPPRKKSCPSYEQYFLSVANAFNPQ